MTGEAHDPTRERAPVPATGVDARFSRSEIEAVAMKAARGAGFDWGVAEEAGMAARCLVEAALPGPDVVLACLEAARGSPPVITGRTWHAPANGLLCPLTSGIALADRATMEDGPGTGGITMRRLCHPALLLPFVRLAAGRLGKNFRVTWPGAEVIAMPEGLCPVLASTLTTPEVPDVKISPMADLAPPLKPVQTGCRVSLDVWRRLDALALATTVPATTSSRAGAGSGGSDND